MDTLETKGEAEGNTNPPRVSNSKRWVFTLHKGVIGDVETALRDKTVKGIIASELGKSGTTPHIQGFVHFKEKVRPFGYLERTTHWEKAKGNDDAQLAYCRKEGLEIREWGFPKPVKICEPKGWQKDMVNTLKGEPEPRKIYWIYGKAGIGKTQFAKYCCVKLGAILLGGKSTDMKYAIMDYKKNKGETPELVILDIPYCKQEYISYEGLEQIKNMLFFNSKYESGMVYGNSPHMVVLANREPDYDKMSTKDWFVVMNVDSYDISSQDVATEPQTCTNTGVVGKCCV